MRKKTKRWILGIVGGIVLLLAWIVLLSPWVWPAPGMDSLVVGRETTWLENPPMNPDGTVNYGKAINDIMTAGVTPENNAMVCFVQAAGLGLQYVKLGVEPRISDRALAEFLGQPVSTLTGPFLTRFWDVIEAMKEARSDEELDLWTLDDQLRKSPWTAKEFPAVRAWVDQNAKAFDLIVKGSKRPRCSHFALYANEESLMDTVDQVSILPELRSVARNLLIRAMGSAGEGDLQSAWKDTMAVRRMARLACQGGFLINHLVAMSLDTFAIDAQDAILASDAIQPAQATAWLKELQSLPPLPSLSVAMEIEMIFTLDAARKFLNADGDDEELKDLYFLEQSPDLLQHMPVLDVPHIMRRIIQDWGKQMEIGNLPSMPERKRAALETHRQLQKDPLTVGRILTTLLSTPSARRKAVTDIVWGKITRTLMDSLSRCHILRDTTQTRAELTRVMAAMAVYRAKHKQWPAKLSDLVPAILPRVPADPWSDSKAPLKYKRTPVGFLLYSIGYNETDDGGVDPGSSAGIYEMQEGDVSISVPPVEK